MKHISLFVLSAVVSSAFASGVSFKFNTQALPSKVMASKLLMTYGVRASSLFFDDQKEITSNAIVKIIDGDLSVRLSNIYFIEQTGNTKTLVSSDSYSARYYNAMPPTNATCSETLRQTTFIPGQYTINFSVEPMKALPGKRLIFDGNYWLDCRVIRTNDA